MLMKTLKDSIIELTKKLVQVPSQAGIDDSQPILQCLSDWFNHNEIKYDFLEYNEEKVGLKVVIKGNNPSKHTYCFNACMDTAPFGDISTWINPPNSAVIIDNWMYGRGAGDSKVAVSIFSHLIKECLILRHSFEGTIIFLFDSDEHSGKFGGVKSLLLNHKLINGVYIGYSGNKNIVVGARGFYRVIISVFGIAAHAGSSKPAKENAILKAIMLIEILKNTPLPVSDDEFSVMGAKLTITSINGGSSFSIIPDKCDIRVDIRLTNAFNKDAAKKLIDNAVNEFEKLVCSERKTSYTEQESWPAYVLKDNSKIVEALSSAYKEVTNNQIELRIAGPSNIGNYLSEFSIDATCGFGVEAENIHGANERINLDTINEIYLTYFLALKKLIFTE